MPVEKCICLRISFEVIRRIALEGNYGTVEELQENGVCSTSCKLCKPYVEQMLKTGETSFEAGSVYQSSGNQ
jgi:bacterioferritin-associated ferredoxin